MTKPVLRVQDLAVTFTSYTESSSTSLYCFFLDFFPDINLVHLNEIVFWVSLNLRKYCIDFLYLQIYDIIHVTHCNNTITTKFSPVEMCINGKGMNNITK